MSFREERSARLRHVPVAAQTLLWRLLGVEMVVWKEAGERSSLTRCKPVPAGRGERPIQWVRRRRRLGCSLSRQGKRWIHLLER